MSIGAPPGPPPVAPVDPRLRARRQQVRRDARRRRVVGVVAVVSLLALAGLAWAVVHSPLLSVARIEVSGTRFADPALVRAAAGSVEGEALLTADLDEVRRAVGALPWVESVSVQRRWPRAVSVSIVERTPSASLLQTDGTWAVVDPTGRVLTVSAAQPAGLVPVVTGGAPVASGGVMDGWRRSAVEAAGGLTPSLTGRLVSVGLDPIGGIVVALRTGGVIWLGTGADLATKQLEALAVLSALGAEPVGTIDVRAAGAPVHVPAPVPPDPLTSPTA